MTLAPWTKIVRKISGKETWISEGEDKSWFESLSKVATRVSPKPKDRQSKYKRQLNFKIEHPIEPDRNSKLGGRSFYFFDFDDNVAFLATPIYLMRENAGKREELALTSGEYARMHRSIGKTGKYQDYFLDYDDANGSFRNFRERNRNWLQKVLCRKEFFISDLQTALGYPELNWKGPSWSCFYHAAHNQRPMSVITARGHSPQTIQQGISEFLKAGFLTKVPNYLSIYPVTHPATRDELLELLDIPSERVATVAELKQAAIRRSVLRAIEIYGASPHHRFGMSDDDPHNIELIAAEMKRLKNEFPEMSFFVIETQNHRFVKWEVLSDRLEAEVCSTKDDFQTFEQLALLKS